MKTPFVEYHVFQHSPVGIIRKARGYQDSLSIWDSLRELVRIAKETGIKDRTIRKDILAAGPCAGLWRTYYAAMTKPQYDQVVSKTDFLGHKVVPNTTIRQLGMDFDSWIEDANRQYNVFLETHDPTCLKKIGGVIGEYYIGRATQHMQYAPTPQDLVKDTLEIKPAIQVLPGLPIDERTPDGVFLGGKKAAVFESKLSQPNYREFHHEMALYALVLESQHKRDVDCAIILYSDPDGRNLAAAKEIVFDSNVNEIARNLERFLSLVQISQLIEQDEGIAKPGYETWKHFLHRPPGLPSDRQSCPSCKYRQTCEKEGADH